MPEIRSKIFSLISVLKLFLKYSMWETYLISIKFARDEDMKPRVHSRFGCFPLGGSGGILPQKCLKIRCKEMLFPAISEIHLSRSLVVYILLYSHASNINRTDSLFF